MGTAVGVVAAVEDAAASSGVERSVGTGVAAVSGVAAASRATALSGVLKASGVGAGFNDDWKSATVWNVCAESFHFATTMHCV